MATMPKENKYPYKGYVLRISKEKRKINEEKIHYSYLTFNLYMLIAETRAPLEKGASYVTYSVRGTSNASIPNKEENYKTVKEEATNKIQFTQPTKIEFR